MAIHYFKYFRDNVMQETMTQRYRYTPVISFTKYLRLVRLRDSKFRQSIRFAWLFQTRSLFHCLRAICHLLACRLKRETNSSTCPLFPNLKAEKYLQGGLRATPADHMLIIIPSCLFWYEARNASAGNLNEGLRCHRVNDRREVVYRWKTQVKGWGGGGAVKEWGALWLEQLILLTRIKIYIRGVMA